MAAVIGELRRDVRVPFGVNILWDANRQPGRRAGDRRRFIREVLTGVYESDLGMIEPQIGEIAGYRTLIGAADVALFDNIAPEFASAIGLAVGGRPRQGRRTSSAWTRSSSAARRPGRSSR